VYSILETMDVDTGKRTVLREFDDTIEAATGCNNDQVLSPDGKSIAVSNGTFDESNNWFGHVSPDGEWVAFVSYRLKT
jgi:Tol biopolymer transport system component